MPNRRIKIFTVFCLLTASLTLQAFSQPPAVPRLTERCLDQASYVQLAKEWKEYIAKNGENAEALVNLGRAYDYSGQLEAAYEVARRALNADHDNPRALEFLGKMLATYKSDEKNALIYLERCRTIAPEYKEGLIMLSVVYLRQGKWNKADDVFKTLFDQRVMPRPLQDLAYNMLVGLPKGAVLITNGDNDTFPPLALQAGMDFRKDVILINRSLLNLESYADAVFKRHPHIKPRGGVKAVENEILSTTLLKKMVNEHKAPIYFASTVSGGGYNFVPEGMIIEGINLRVAKEGTGPEESARLFFEKYRLDSATDWDFAWSLLPSISKLMKNYVSGMIKSSMRDGIAAPTKKRLLDKALEIARFHEMSRLESNILAMQKNEQ